jgi:hypothetical protein
MSGVAVESPTQVTRPSRNGRRPEPDFAELHEGIENFQLWELHSELVLVDPELRRRSLQMLREREQELSAAPPPRPVLVPPPVEAPVPTDDVQVERTSVVRYAARRVGEAVRLGLTIIGALVLLALLAQAIAH